MRISGMMNVAVIVGPAPLPYWCTIIIWQAKNGSISAAQKYQG